MRKHSFVVHAGSDTKGDVLFMEVCLSQIVFLEPYLKAVDTIGNYSK